MLLKSTDPLERYLVELVQAQGMLGSHEHAFASSITTHQQLCVTAFHEFAGFLNDSFQGDDELIVSHDLRVQCEIGAAHIDHLLITRFLDVFLIESRISGDELVIGEDEEFSVRYRDGTSFRIRSPITQLRRGLAVAQHIFRRIELPTKFGETIVPTFHRFVLLPDTTRLVNHSTLRPDYFVSHKDLVRTVKRAAQRSPIKAVLLGLSAERLRDIARIVVRWHTPEKVDFIRKYLATPAVD